MKFKLKSFKVAFNKPNNFVRVSEKVLLAVVSFTEKCRSYLTQRLKVSVAKKKNGLLHFASIILLADRLASTCSTVDFAGCILDYVA